MPREHQIDPSLEVLVVDDDTDVRELLVEFFRDLNFSVASASDGRAAITAIEQEPRRYWLIVTDIIMPGADGLAVLRAARTANPEANVVIVTGYNFHGNSAGDPIPTEEVSLGFTEIEWTYAILNPETGSNPAPRGSRR